MLGLTRSTSLLSFWLRQSIDRLDPISTSTHLSGEADVRLPLDEAGERPSAALFGVLLYRKTSCQKIGDGIEIGCSYLTASNHRLNSHSFYPSRLVVPGFGECARRADRAATRPWRRAGIPAAARAASRTERERRCETM